MQTITNIDFIILDFLHEKLSCGFLDIIMPMITFLGNAGMIWIATALILLFIRKHRKNTFMLMGGLVCCAVVRNLRV